MKFSHIVKRVAKRYPFEEELVQKFINDLIKETKKELTLGNNINIFRFGTFKITNLKMRSGFIPGTRMKILFKPRKKVKFISSTLLTKAINKKGYK